MSICVVDLADDGDQVLLLASLYERLANSDDEQAGGDKDTSLSEQFQQLLQNENARDILEKLLEHHKLLWVEGGEQDALKALTLFTSILLKEDADFVAEMTPRLLDTIAIEPKTTPKAKLNVLASLYNLFDAKKQGFAIYSRLLAFALESNTGSEVSGDFSNIESRLSGWQADTAQKRQIYKLIANIGQQQNADSEETLTFMKKYFDYFEDPDEASDSFETALECMRNAVILALKVSYRFDDLLSCKLLEGLKKKGGDDALYYRIVEIFTKEDTSSFMEFEKANKSFLEKTGLNSEQLLEKMRLISLITLCSVESTLPYSKVAQALQTDEENVERWVIKAIAAKVITARLDQNTSSVIVTHSLLRSFGPPEWKDLQGRLKTWKQNIDKLVTVVSEAIQQPTE